MTLEVCIASLADARSAEQCGADRLELNVVLELGGLTPTAGLLQQVKQAVAVPVIAMIRPRGKKRFDRPVNDPASAELLLTPR